MDEPSRRLEYSSVRPAPLHRRHVHWSEEMHLWGTGCVFALIGLAMLACGVLLGGYHFQGFALLSAFFLLPSIPLFVRWAKKRTGK
jgi:hypothetical protein